jgi:dihydroxyacid dehydratase/phosphogluconate dehydratase
MTAHQLRSRNWFGRNDLDGFVHRSWLKAEGFSNAVFDGRPVVGIANSWSELTNCNAHLRQVADAVKRGVWSAGGFPVEFPTISLGEVLMNPTTMLFRNLMAMDVEECLCAYPLDAAVLLPGCDKTTPAMLMDGRLRGHSGRHGHRRSDAQRQVARRGARLRQRRLAAVGRAARRASDRRGAL